MMMLIKATVFTIIFYFHLYHDGRIINFIFLFSVFVVLDRHILASVFSLCRNTFRKWQTVLSNALIWTSPTFQYILNIGNWCTSGLLFIINISQFFLSLLSIRVLRRRQRRLTLHIQDNTMVTYWSDPSSIFAILLPIPIAHQYYYYYYRIWLLLWWYLL